MKEPAIGSVEHAEAILPRFHFQVREEFPVYQDGIAENFWHPRRLRIVRCYRVVELPLKIEDPVVECQRNFVLTPGQIQGIFKFIANEECAKESSKYIEPVNAQSMVVVPKQ